MYRLKLAVILLVLIHSFGSLAQGWELTYDGGGFELAGLADATPEGGLVVAGRQTDEDFGLNYPFFYRIDDEGTLLWEYYDSVHSNNNVTPFDILSTSDSNYLFSFRTGILGQSTDYFLQKIDSEGNLVWEKTYPGVPEVQYIHTIEETNDGDFILLCGGNSVIVLKIDEDGEALWSNTYPNTNFFQNPQDIIETQNGELVVLSTGEYLDGDAFPVLKRLDSSGNLLWENEYDENQNDNINLKLVELSNGDFVIGGLVDVQFPTVGFFPSLRRVDGSGNQVWFQTYSAFPEDALSNSFTKTTEDELIYGGSTITINGSRDFYLIKFDVDGNVIWNKEYGTSKNEVLGEVLSHSQGGFYLAGYVSVPSTLFDVYVVKTDSLGNSFVNEINGNVFHDIDENCMMNSGESGLSRWILEATNGNISYTSVTDSVGNYSISLDTGTYELSAYPISPYWTFCNNSYTIDFPIQNDTVTQDFAAQSEIDCPLLNVSISTPFLRRCFDNTYYVHYCNDGTLPAEDAYIEVILDPYMEYLNSTIPLSSQVEDTLTFDIGEVGIGECGDFQIEVSLEVEGEPCDSLPFGLTHCVEAHMFPDSICLPNNNWSGASIEVDAFCEGDSIIFFIQNVGDAPTQPNLEYIVIEDDVVLLEGNFPSIESGQFETLTVFTNGATFRLEVDQEPNHPGMSMPSVSVEGCGGDDIEFHFGFINIFSPDDADPFVDVDCRENVGAYDPNDKTGFPLGVGTPNFIERGEDIEYLIRFQNTGTDTAFNIVILDTLTENLDITSIRLGASSHPYNFDIVDSMTLSFSFNNIMLPDSNVNEVASHGFVKFKIAQINDLPLETEIYNSAAIYFDFNSPIITNQTFHTIGEDFLESISFYPDAASLATVKVFPNPFNESTNIMIEGAELNQATFKIYNAMGHLIRSEIFTDNVHFFYKKNLTAGLYFFGIEENGVLVGSGKLMVE